MTRKTIGRVDRPHLEVESVQNGGVKVSVLKPNGYAGILVGYAYLGAEDGGYVIHRVESWACEGNKVNISRTVLRCLSIKKFEALLQG